MVWMACQEKVFMLEPLFQRLANMARDLMRLWAVHKHRPCEPKGGGRAWLPSWSSSGGLSDLWWCACIACIDDIWSRCISTQTSFSDNDSGGRVNTWGTCNMVLGSSRTTARTHTFEDEFTLPMDALSLIYHCIIIILNSIRRPADIDDIGTHARAFLQLSRWATKLPALTFMSAQLGQQCTSSQCLPDGRNNCSPTPTNAFMSPYTGYKVCWQVICTIAMQLSIHRCYDITKEARNIRIDSIRLDVSR